MQLPVLRTDDLKSTIYCLQRESLILGPEVLDILQCSIDNSMYGKSALSLSTSTAAGGNSKYKYSISQNAEGENDIVGRMDDVTVSSGGGGGGGGSGGISVATYNSAVFLQILDNIISTYYSVIGDLLPTLPVEIDVFAVFQIKLSNTLKYYVKATFSQHKQLMTPADLIKMVAFYDKLAQFCDKFSKTTTPNIIKNVSEMRPDVLRQCNTALVASLAEQMLKCFNADEPAMSADVDLEVSC